MYTVIRRYEGIKSIDEVIRRATSEFAPLLAKQPGFQGYYTVKGSSQARTSRSSPKRSGRQQTQEPGASAARSCAADAAEGDRPMRLLRTHDARPLLRHDPREEDTDALAAVEAAQLALAQYRDNIEPQQTLGMTGFAAHFARHPAQRRTRARR